MSEPKIPTYEEASSKESPVALESFIIYYETRLHPLMIEQWRQHLGFLVLEAYHEGITEGMNLSLDILKSEALKKNG